MIRRNVLILTAILFLTPAFRFSTDQLKKRGREGRREGLESKGVPTSFNLSRRRSAHYNLPRIAPALAQTLPGRFGLTTKACTIAFCCRGQDINLGLQPPESGEPQEDNTFMVFLHLRSDTIERIAKYDPEFAYDFLKTTQPPDEQMPQAGREKERALTLRLAKQVSDKNPDIALKLGRAALADRPSEELLTLLRPLLRKHREQGVTLYKEIVGKLRKAKLTEDYVLINFVRGFAQITPPLADDTGFRELINILMTAAFANKCDKGTDESEAGYFCSEIGPLLAQMGGVDPQRAAKLKHLAPEYDGTPWTEVQASLEELAEARDLDGLLRLARSTLNSKTRFGGVHSSWLDMPEIWNALRQ